MTKKAQIDERRKAIVCMEYIARHINDEDVLDFWLMNGVPDGDIEYGNLDYEQVWSEDYMVSDEGFEEIMSCFLRNMNRAFESGGLFCGGIVCKDKSDYNKPLYEPIKKEA